MYIITLSKSLDCKITLLYSLQHLVFSLRHVRATWTVDSALHQALAGFAGDIVQAMQALKEANPRRGAMLEAQISALLSYLEDCRWYCEEARLDYPLWRAERQVADTLYLLYPRNWTEDITDEHTPARDQLIDIKLSAQQPLESFALGPFRVPRLFNGFWQLSSHAWGSGSASSQDKALARLIQAGFTASDMADHYVRVTVGSCLSKFVDL
jgi:hypothetical protein